MHIQPAFLLAARREMKQFIIHPSLHVLTAAIAPRGTLKSTVEQGRFLEQGTRKSSKPHSPTMRAATGQIWSTRPGGLQLHMGLSQPCSDSTPRGTHSTAQSSTSLTKTAVFSPSIWD